MASHHSPVTSHADDSDNPFLVSSSASRQLRQTSTLQQQHMDDDDDDNPFIVSSSASKRTPNSQTRRSSRSSSTTPSRNYVSAVPHVVEYNASSSSSSDQQAWQLPHSPIAKHRQSIQPSPSRLHAYSPARPSLMSPTSIRHYHHRMTQPPPAPPQFSKQPTRDASEKQSSSSSSKNSEINRAKLELKTWEVNFKKTHGRDATQDDIAKDAVMVQKYRAYGKLKKAAKKAAESSQSTSKQPKSVPPEAVDKAVIKSPTIPMTRTRSSDLLRTPTKSSRTRHYTDAELLKTPTKEKKVEYVSPHKVAYAAGLMSPGRHNQLDQERHLFLSSVTASPTTSRTQDLLVSPSSRSRTNSLLLSPSFKLSSSRSPTSLSLMARLSGSPSGRKTPRGSTFLTNPLRSPTRSPLFGGMNNRRKRPVKKPAPTPEDLEPVREVDEAVFLGSEMDKERETTPTGVWTESTTLEIESTASPLLKTPQKSGAAKAARSLFRRPSVPLNLFPATTPPYHGEPAFPSDDIQEEITKSPSRRKSRTPVPHNALSEMVDSSAPSFDAHQDESYQNLDVMQSPVLSRDEYPSPGYPSIQQRSPSISRRTPEPPRTPSQQPSLTFSQTTPGSARSEPDLFFVPPGYHSLYRRRQVRPSLFLASQEDDAEFEREYNVAPADRERQQQQQQQQQEYTEHNDTMNVLGFDDHDDHEDTFATGDRVRTTEDGDDGVDDEEDGQATELWQAAKAPKKKYTQKRTTRLHRIAVAPSVKSKPSRASSRLFITDDTLPNQTADVNVTVRTDAELDTELDSVHTSEAKEKATKTSSKQQSKSTSSIAPTSLSSSDNLPTGWANSNKPLVKSDRGKPGLGQGRAGVKKSAGSYNGGGAAGVGGNYVAYNLQRGSFKKRGRGGSRFGGSGYGNAATMASGRSLFDNDSWRTDFDKDYEDNMLMMSLADDGLDTILGEDDDGLPWYGAVHDPFDPHVVTISPKFTRGVVGEANDPDEYIRELELQQTPADGLDGTVVTRSEEVKVNLQHILQKVWGYPSFRDGQLDSVKRILRYESSLLVLPTGSGKSLSYQLPAYVLSKLGVPSLTLVISPMISLMYDQVKHLPPGLTGACWTSVEQTTAQFKDFMEKLRNNTIKILFISPEKLQSQSFLSLVKTKQIPRISFLCVDEVHCLSEWSHNFRPAYLLLNHVLKTDLKSPCVLGLTGTATEGTKDSICTMLEIDRLTGVLSGPVIRENLAMSVSLESDRDTALLHLLQSPKFAAMDSILIYVMKQVQADALAAFLRVRNFSAESYHAGKSAQDRQRIQDRFMNTNVVVGGGGGGGRTTGGIRILCATIAFGLGLNKSNIRSVIHYSMPKSLENYIQEIGRSGRDGLPAYCHMFLNQSDYLSLRSLAYANGIDLGSLLRLIKKLLSRRSLMPATRGATSLSSSAKSTAKKRRRLPNSVSTGDDGSSSWSEEAGSDDEEDEHGQQTAKKQRRNDSRAVPVKVGGSKTKMSEASTVAFEQQCRNLVTSGESILVIPPPPSRHPLTGTIAMISMDTNESRIPKRLVVVREEFVEQEFDIKKEVLATLLSYIELDASQAIKVTGSISSKCTVKFLKEDEELANMLNENPLMESVMKYGVMTGHNSAGGGGGRGKGRKAGGHGIGGSTLSNAYCSDTMSVCQANGISYTEFVQELQLWKRKKWVMYELTDPGLCVEILREPSECMVKERALRSVLAARKKKNKKKSKNSKNSKSTSKEVVDDGLMDDGGDHEEENEEDYGEDHDHEDDHDQFIRILGDRLYQKLCAVEQVGVAKVDHVYELFHKVATPTWQQQEALRPRALASDDEEDEDEDEEDDEEDEDVDGVDDDHDGVRRERRRAKKSLSIEGMVTEAEQVLREGIQVYFARQSGQGIGGPKAAEEMFKDLLDDDDEEEEEANTSKGEAGIGKKSVVIADKMIQYYGKENPIVASMQRQWRSAVEVDLKVFLAQQWQHYQQQQQSSSSSSMSMGRKPMDSPRVVCRIFHGIHSPCYPAMEWARDRCWGKYVHFDFGTMMQMADRIMKEQRHLRAAQSQGSK